MESTAKCQTKLNSRSSHCLISLLPKDLGCVPLWNMLGQPLTGLHRQKLPLILPLCMPLLQVAQRQRSGPHKLNIPLTWTSWAGGLELLHTLAQQAGELCRQGPSPRCKLKANDAGEDWPSGIGQGLGGDWFITVLETVSTCCLGSGTWGCRSGRHAATGTMTRASIISGPYSTVNKIGHWQASTIYEGRHSSLALVSERTLMNEYIRAQRYLTATQTHAVCTVCIFTH